jgi:hypothetical protein
MADEKHVYCVFRGGYNDTALSAERWQFGVRLWVDTSVPDDSGTLPSTGDFVADDYSGTFANGTIVSQWAWLEIGGPVLDVPGYLEDQAFPAIAAFLAQPYLSNEVHCTEVKLYPILSTGQAFEHRSATMTFTTPAAGTGTANMMPPEVSIAVSWQTPQIGRRGRGRIYLPPSTTASFDDLGYVESGDQDDIAAAAATFLSDLAVESVGADAVHVRPIVTGAPWTKYGVIQSVNVGRVADAQRRRRRQLDEGPRSEEPVVYG